MNDYKQIPLEELAIDTRTYNGLKNEGINTVGDVLAKGEQILLRIPNFGRKSLNNLNDALLPMGIMICRPKRRHVSFSLSGETFERLSARAKFNNRLIETEMVALLDAAVDNDANLPSVFERLDRLEAAVFQSETFGR